MIQTPRVFDVRGRMRKKKPLLFLSTSLSRDTVLYDKRSVACRVTSE